MTAHSLHFAEHVGHEIRAQLGTDRCACGAGAMPGTGRCFACAEKRLDRLLEFHRGDLSAPGDDER